MLQLLRGVEGYVCLVAVKKLLYILLVYVAALALAVRAFVAAEAHSLVELDAEPSERFDDILFCSWHETARIGVLNAEHQVAAMLTGKQIIV